MSSEPRPPTDGRAAAGGADPDGAAAARRLAEVAERLDSLADTSELMGDDDGAARFRDDAARCRAQAMDRLDGADRDPG